MSNQGCWVWISVVDPAQQEWGELGVDGAAGKEEGEEGRVEVGVGWGGEVVEVAVDFEAEFGGEAEKG